jgi:hypothetical protein
MKLVLMYKLIAALVAVVVGTAATGGGVALAAEGSLPGDTLYPVKIAVEDARLSWANSPAAEATLNLAFADKRVAEMEQLSAKGQAIPAEEIARMTRHTEQAMQQISQAPLDEIPGLLTQVMERTATQEQVLRRAMGTAPEPAQPGLEQAIQIATQTRERAAEGIGDPGRYQNEYRNREQKRDQDPGITPSATPQQDRDQEQKRDQLQDRDTTATPQQDRDQEQKRDQFQDRDTTATPQQDRDQEQKRDQFQDRDTTATPQQDRDQEQKRDQLQDRNMTATPTVTPQQNREQEQNRNTEVTPSATMQQNREQEENRNIVATPSATPRQQEQEKTQNGTDTPTQVPQPTHTPQPRRRRCSGCAPGQQRQHNNSARTVSYGRCCVFRSTGRDRSAADRRGAGQDSREYAAPSPPRSGRGS